MNNILQAVNHHTPGTIARLSLVQKYDPDTGAPLYTPFMDVFVQLFEGAKLPTPASVAVYQAEYEAYLQAQDAAKDAEKKRQAALEAKWPDPFALVDDILERGIATVKAERVAIKEANPKIETGEAVGGVKNG